MHTYVHNLFYLELYNSASTFRRFVKVHTLIGVENYNSLWIFIYDQKTPGGDS